MPLEELEITVPLALKGKRLDQALGELCPQFSRSRLQSWIKSGYIKVNKKLPKQRDIVQGGEDIIIRVEITQADKKYAKEDIPLDVIYQDQDVIVVNKPPGLVIHPGAGNPEHTLLNALLYHFSELEQLPRAGIVQRLDKDTSGLMIIARSVKAHTSLVNQLQNRLITREYESIVMGVLTAGGTIDAPIGRHPVKRKRMAIVDSGKQAITHYRVLKKFSAHTYVRLRLESGRTHQIRVHMAHIKHPLVGDPVYGGRPKFAKNADPELVNQLQHFSRQALHAVRLVISHPSTLSKMEWKASVPDDMNLLLSLLESNEH